MDALSGYKSEESSPDEDISSAALFDFSSYSKTQNSPLLPNFEEQSTFGFVENNEKKDPILVEENIQNDDEFDSDSKFQIEYELIDKSKILKEESLEEKDIASRLTLFSQKPYTPIEMPSDLRKQMRYIPEKYTTNENKPKINLPQSLQSCATYNAEKLFYLMATYQPKSILGIQKQIVHHLEFTLARNRINIDCDAMYMATALSIRDRMIELWNDSQLHVEAVSAKRVFYLSIEWLIGRMLLKNLHSLKMYSLYEQAIKELGFDLQTIAEIEKDAALGNGGLGRLAACYIDSASTLGIPFMGYGLQYQYGMFQQKIIDGYQHELPDYWLTQGNPWQIKRLDIEYTVQFGGKIELIEKAADVCLLNFDVETGPGSPSQLCPEAFGIYKWTPDEEIIAVANDILIPGYDNRYVATLRLWSSEPSHEFDLLSFNKGDYFQALKARQHASELTSVLYPDDSTVVGKELRFKQQYFFTSASLQDILYKFFKVSQNWDKFREMVSIQLNDTHPTLAIPELIRILIDDYRISFSESFSLCKSIFNFTNHTVLPEALETWSVDLINRLLPRHMLIIYEINHEFLQNIRMYSLKNDYSYLKDKLSEVSIILENNGDKRVRMANLAIICSKRVNGVAKLHTSIIKNSIFQVFYQLWPLKFVNITNGVTPRRWLNITNPMLSKFYNVLLGDVWIKNMRKLSLIRDKFFQNEKQKLQLLNVISQTKWQCKNRALKFLLTKLFTEEELFAIKRNESVDKFHHNFFSGINQKLLWDIQIKRVHEYKRQLLNILHVIHLYICKKKKIERVPRLILIGGKAAPGYDSAKKIIKLINSVAEVINQDAEISETLKVVFLPDYNVTSAEYIIPASDINEQISTAGMEASGTSNMKFVMNGSLIIGTNDGANVEIAEKIGQERMFIFGSSAEEVEFFRKEKTPCKIPSTLKIVIKFIKSGMFGDYALYENLINPIEEGNDFYLIAKDWDSYLQAQEDVETSFLNPNDWFEKVASAMLSMDYFSSDRSIKEYCENIWNCSKVDIPDPVYIEETETFVSSAYIKAKQIKSDNKISVKKENLSDITRESKVPLPPLQRFV
eukprot:TRINITY_DN9791_c0_g1_i1.p1 TRINITY_DN9791_c0_g1~~TRINITY_DN9791_c0_g1_i1.p1  ORF type:complete len:1091 (-),score=267.84 TRINITY_DN9791_c0_g1_i1:206-3439(-)